MRDLFGKNDVKTVRANFQNEAGTAYQGFQNALWDNSNFSLHASEANTTIGGTANLDCIGIDLKNRNANYDFTCQFATPLLAQPITVHYSGTRSAKSSLELLGSVTVKPGQVDQLKLSLTYTTSPDVVEAQNLNARLTDTTANTSIDLSKVNWDVAHKKFNATGSVTHKGKTTSVTLNCSSFNVQDEKTYSATCTYQTTNMTKAANVRFDSSSN
jgi:hypothetical protein